MDAKQQDRLANLAFYHKCAQGVYRRLGTVGLATSVFRMHNLTKRAAAFAWHMEQGRVGQ